MTVIRLSFAVAFAFALTLPLSALAASDEPDPPLPPNSCFAPPDHCLKQLARTHDRRDYELCLLSEQICRSYRASWSLSQRIMARSPTMEEGLPIAVNSVGELLRICRGDQLWEQEACHQTVAPLTRDAALRGKSWRSRRTSRAAVACSGSASLSEQAYETAFVDWAERHPSQQNLSVSDGVTAATAAAWPCRGKTARWHRRQRS